MATQETKVDALHSIITAGRKCIRFRAEATTGMIEVYADFLTDRGIINFRHFFAEEMISECSRESLRAHIQGLLEDLGDESQVREDATRLKSMRSGATPMNRVIGVREEKLTELRRKADSWDYYQELVRAHDCESITAMATELVRRRKELEEIHANPI